MHLITVKLNVLSHFKNTKLGADRLFVNHIFFYLNKHGRRKVGFFYCLCSHVQWLDHLYINIRNNVSFLIFAKLSYTLLIYVEVEMSTQATDEDYCLAYSVASVIQDTYNEYVPDHISSFNIPTSVSLYAAAKTANF